METDKKEFLKKIIKLTNELNDVNDTFDMVIIVNEMEKIYDEHIMSICNKANNIVDHSTNDYIVDFDRMNNITNTEEIEFVNTEEKGIVDKRIDKITAIFQFISGMSYTLKVVFSTDSFFVNNIIKLSHNEIGEFKILLTDKLSDNEFLFKIFNEKKDKNKDDKSKIRMMIPYNAEYFNSTV